MQYEIEIKSLLGSKDRADQLLDSVRKTDPNTSLISTQSQLNHYFKNGTLADLVKALNKYISTDDVNKIMDIEARAKSINVRTRDKNGTVLLIVKGSLDEGSAAHSHRRMEFEAEVALDIDALDALIISAGYDLEAKWQAERKIYSALDMNIDMIFSPGYGYVVEFEKVLDSEADIESARSTILDTMQQLGVAELPKDRLERMYAYYNDNWHSYYGTDKVFEVT